MFRCDVCGSVAPPGTPCNRITVETRVVEYPLREKVHWQPPKAGGQGKWSGRILRFGHMGDVGIDEMAEALEIMGDTLPAFGHDADGAAAGAAARAAFEAQTAGAR